MYLSGLRYQRFSWLGSGDVANFFFHVKTQDWNLKCSLVLTTTTFTNHHETIEASRTKAIKEGRLLAMEKGRYHTWDEGHPSLLSPAERGLSQVSCCAILSSRAKSLTQQQIQQASGKHSPISQQDFTTRLSRPVPHTARKGTARETIQHGHHHSNDQVFRLPQSDSIRLLS